MENRYILMPSEKEGYTICIDRQSGVKCLFKNKEFNEDQEFGVIEGFSLDANDLARGANEMGIWLRDNHYLKICPMPPLRLWLGVRIKQMRIKRGMSQEELAEKSGLSFATINRIEGARFAARLDVLEKICEALGCDIDLVE